MQYKSYLSHHLTPPRHHPNADINPSLPLHGELGLPPSTRTPSLSLHHKSHYFLPTCQRQLPHRPLANLSLSFFCILYVLSEFCLSHLPLSLSLFSYSDVVKFPCHTSPSYFVSTSSVFPSPHSSNPLRPLFLLFNYLIYSATSWDSSISRVTWLRAAVTDRFCFDSWQGQYMFISPNISTPALRTTQFPILQRVPGMIPRERVTVKSS